MSARSNFEEALQTAAYWLNASGRSLVGDALLGAFEELQKEWSTTFSKREAENIVNSADAQCFRWLLKHHSGTGLAIASQGERCWIGGVEFCGHDVRDAITEAIDQEEYATNGHE